MASQLEIVLFDLGGVLLPFDRERRVRTLSRALGVTAEAARDFMALDLHGRLDLGQADDAELAQALSDLAGWQVPVAAARALIPSVFMPSNSPLRELGA